MVHLAVCHTVVIEEKKGKKFYNASSPDELALVNAAKYYHHEFKGRDEEQFVEVVEHGEVVKYKLLNVIEFTSARKRMTVIVRTPDDKIKVIFLGTRV